MPCPEVGGLGCGVEECAAPYGAWGQGKPVLYTCRPAGAGEAGCHGSIKGACAVAVWGMKLNQAESRLVDGYFEPPRYLRAGRRVGVPGLQGWWLVWSGRRFSGK